MNEIFRFQVLEDIGFTKSEAFDILTHGNAPSFLKNQEDLYFPSHDYMTTMKYRLNLLRKNSSQLGLSSHVHFWYAMVNW